MLEFSEGVLKRGYTIYVSKKVGQSKLQGTYLKGFRDGLHPQELPEKELSPLIHLSNIVEYLEQGNILQVHQDGFSINGVVGTKKTEGQYCGTEYLEVVEQKSGYNYQEMLIDLDMELSYRKNQRSNQANQYTKLYKGADRYE